MVSSEIIPNWNSCKPKLNFIDLKVNINSIFNAFVMILDRNVSGSDLKNLSPSNFRLQFEPF